MRRKGVIQLVLTATLPVFLLLASGCGKPPEAVITVDGEEVTDVQDPYETLPVSSAKKFSYADLTVDRVQYLMTEMQVKDILGEPVSVYELKENKDIRSGQETEEAKETSSETSPAGPEILERVYSYNELTLIFSMIRGEYLLTAAASVGDNEVFARGLKVGDSIEDLLAVYYREPDCFNNIYYSQDRTAKLGNYLYGSYTLDALDQIKTADRIAYGVINLNGYASLEAADSLIVEMTCFEPPYLTGTASVRDDFAQIAFDVDRDGKITAIRWYYYPEEES